MPTESTQTFQFLKDAIVFWPILVVVFTILNGFFHFRIKAIIDKDIRGVSLKIDKSQAHTGLKLDEIEKNFTKQHLELSVSIARLEGRLYPYKPNEQSI